MSHPLTPVYAIQTAEAKNSVSTIDSVSRNILSNGDTVAKFDWGKLCIRQIIANGFTFSYQTYQIQQPVSILFSSDSDTGIVQCVFQKEMIWVSQDDKETMRLSPNIYYLRFYSVQQEWVQFSTGQYHFFQLVLSPVLLTHVLQSISGMKRDQLSILNATAFLSAFIGKRAKDLLVQTVEQLTSPQPDLLALNILGTLLTTQFIADSLRMIRRRSWEAKKQFKLEELKSYIDDHLDTDDRIFLQIAVLAKRMNLSVHQFKKLFKQQFGQAPAPFIRSLRMTKAMQLLAVEKFAPGEIYTWVGFENFAAFTKSFTAYYGQPPSYYRSRS